MKHYLCAKIMKRDGTDSIKEKLFSRKSTIICYLCTSKTQEVYRPNNRTTGLTSTPKFKDMSIAELLIYIIIRGITIGIIVSAPMGPIGVLCIQRTLNKGRRSGIATGLGASLSDLFYAMLTGFGMSIVIDFIETNEAIIQIIGSLVLMGFGIYLYRQNPARNIRKRLMQKNSFIQDFTTSFLLTLSNPLILFLFIGLFARLNFFLPEMTLFHYILGYIAILIGAIIWWLTITFFINKVRSRFNLRSLWLINRGIGAIIIIMSLVGFGTGIIEYFTK